MALCQWASWARGTDHWDPRWHRRTVVFVLWCLFRGLMSPKGALRTIECKPLTPAIKVDPKVGSAKVVKENTEEALRAAGNNTIHSVSLIHLEGWPLQRKIRGLRTIADPLIRNYRTLRREGQSHETILRFYSDMVQKESLGRIRDLFQSLQDPKILKRLGLIVTQSDIQLVGLSKSAELALLDEEAEFGSWLGKLQFSC